MTKRIEKGENYPLKVQRSESEWKQMLSESEYTILRQSGTERAFTGKYTDEKAKGVYHCKGCGHVLFSSDEKFSSGCGWPSFFDVTKQGGSDVKVLLRDDRSHGMVRTEVLCANCQSHLGHLFHGEPFDTPTKQRYCINSACLDLKKT